MLASIQGGCSPLQRGLHAARTASGDEEVMGYSIDGLYAGESSEMRTKCIRAAIKALPDAGIRVLSGGDGSPDEVLGAVAAGIDIIEGDYPFRRARDGLASDLRGGKLVNVRDRNWLLWKGALVEGCGCFVCVGGVSRAYLRHLFEVHEMLGVSLVCAHNLWDYFEWFQDVREAVGTGNFELFVRDFEQCRDKVRCNVTN